MKKIQAINKIFEGDGKYVGVTPLGNIMYLKGDSIHYETDGSRIEFVTTDHLSAEGFIVVEDENDTRQRLYKARMKKRK